MFIVVTGWLYVVLMMSITEDSVIAGIMTFLLYGVLPLSIILYLTGGQRRRRNRALNKKQAANASDSPAEKTDAQNGANTVISEHAESGPSETEYRQKDVQ